jgi:uncharacterized protein (TIGR02300 family)
MVKPEWGTKRTCPKCSTRFYDLTNDNPVHCVECGTEWVPEPVLKSKQPMAFEPAAAPVKEPAEDPELAAEDLAVDEDAEISADEEVDLETGRMRALAGDPAGAVEALTRLVAARPGTVEGRFWLARALAAQGDTAAASRTREEAWREYVALPRFRRQHERRFAWRLRPWRPARVAAAVLLALALVLLLVG